MSIHQQPTQTLTHAFVLTDTVLSFFITQICVWSCSQALEAVNTRLRELYPESEELFDVVLMTNNHAYVGLRLINTINHYRELLIEDLKDKNFKVVLRSIFMWSNFWRLGLNRTSTKQQT